MKIFQRRWLLVLAVLMAASLISCQTTSVGPPSGQTPVEAPPPIKTPAEAPTLAQAPTEKPTPVEAPAEELPPVEPYQDLSSLIYSDPSQVDNTNLPITPVEKLGITGNAPHVDISTYRLSVDGLVETPLSLTYDAILAYPTYTEVVLLICPGVFADNAEWTGVPVSTILEEANIKPEASEVTFYAIDGYRVVKPLEVVQQEGVFLAHTVNGEILPAEHGYPLRLVVKGEYGSNWIKWVERIEVT